MANLIITVIAIALVAIASLMGAYYGGAAFLNNQTAANASTVLNEAQQLAGAFNSYAANNLNQAPSAIGGTTATTLQGAGYIASVPMVPASPGVGGTSNPAATMTVGTANGHYFAWALMGSPNAADTPSLTESNFQACAKIIKTATGAAPTNTAIAATTVGAIYKGTYTGNGTFGCAYTGGAGVTSAALSGSTIPGHMYTMEYLLQ